MTSLSARGTHREVLATDTQNIGEGNLLRHQLQLPVYFRPQTRKSDRVGGIVPHGNCTIKLALNLDFLQLILAY